MITVIKLGIVIGKSTEAFECDGVLNPAVIKYDGIIHMLYRAVNKGNYSTIGYCTLTNLKDIRNSMDRPILIPEQPYEAHEMEDPIIVNNVCFPSGAIVEDDILYIYYGAADERIGCASISLSGPITEILLYKN